jgi:hypothetical protein
MILPFHPAIHGTLAIAIVDDCKQKIMSLYAIEKMTRKIKHTHIHPAVFWNEKSCHWPKF